MLPLGNLDRAKDWRCDMTRSATALALLAAALFAPGSPADTHKCVSTDGSVEYRQTPCPSSATPMELRIETSPPSGGGAKDPGNAYSVENQLKAMESARKPEHRERGAAERNETRKKGMGPGYDKARCAKQRAEAARWEREARRGGSDHQEREYRTRMWEYHQALVERYCRPE
jgi:hypothetical protein